MLQNVIECVELLSVIPCNRGIKMLKTIKFDTALFNLGSYSTIIQATKTQERVCAIQDSTLNEETRRVEQIDFVQRLQAL